MVFRRSSSCPLKEEANEDICLLQQHYRHASTIQASRDVVANNSDAKALGLRQRSINRIIFPEIASFDGVDKDEVMAEKTSASEGMNNSSSTRSFSAPLGKPNKDQALFKKWIVSLQKQKNQSPPLPAIKRNKTRNHDDDENNSLEKVLETRDDINEDTLVSSSLVQDMHQRDVKADEETKSMLHLPSSMSWHKLGPQEDDKDFPEDTNRTENDVSTSFSKNKHEKGAGSTAIGPLVSRVDMSMPTRDSLIPNDEMITFDGLPQPISGSDTDVRPPCSKPSLEVASVAITSVGRSTMYSDSKYDGNCNAESCDALDFVNWMFGCNEQPPTCIFSPTDEETRFGGVAQQKGTFTGEVEEFYNLDSFPSSKGVSAARGERLRCYPLVQNPQDYGDSEDLSVDGINSYKRGHSLLCCA